MADSFYSFTAVLLLSPEKGIASNATPYFRVRETTANGSFPAHAALSHTLMKNDDALKVALPVQKTRGAQGVSFRSLADWVAEIKQMVSQRRTNTIELGKLVCAAKRELRFGQWGQLWRTSKLSKLPFGKRHAEKLVVIGNGLGHLNANSCSHLPAAFRTLYYLAQLERMLLANLISQGRIHAALTSNQAKDLSVSRTPKSQDKSKDFQIKRWLARLRKQVQTRLPGLPESDRRMAAAVLQQLAQEITTYGHATAVRHDRSADFQSISRHEPRESCSDREPSRFAARSVEEIHQNLQASSPVRSAADGDRPRSATLAASPQRAPDTRQGEEIPSERNAQTSRRPDHVRHPLSTAAVAPIFPP